MLFLGVPVVFPWFFHKRCLRFPRRSQRFSQVFPNLFPPVLFPRLFQGFPRVVPRFQLGVVSGLSMMYATPRGCVHGLLGSCRRRFPSVEWQRHVGICRRRFLMTPGNFSYEGLLARASSSFLFETPFRSSGLPVVAISGHQFSVFRYFPRRRSRRGTTPTACGRDDAGCLTY